MSRLWPTIIRPLIMTQAAAAHLNLQAGVWLYDLDGPDYDVWICMSTGRLCIDLGATSSTKVLLAAPTLRIFTQMIPALNAHPQFFLSAHRVRDSNILPVQRLLNWNKFLADLPNPRCSTLRQPVELDGTDHEGSRYQLLFKLCPRFIHGCLPQTLHDEHAKGCT